MKRGGRQAREITRSTEMASSSSMKQEKDNTIIVLALAAPGTKFKPPQPRKRNRASSSNGAKSKGASTAGPSGTTKLQESTTFVYGRELEIMEEATGFVHQTGTVNTIQQNQEEPAVLNQQQPAYLGLAHGGQQIPLEAAGITKLKESTTFAHGRDQITEEATGFVHQIGTVNSIQQNQEEPAGLNQQQPAYLGLAHDGPQIPLEAAGISMPWESTVANGIEQIMEEATGSVQNQDTVNNIQQNQEPVGLNQQQPDLGLANGQIPEEVAAGPADPEDMSEVFEFALNNSILDL